MSVPGRSTPRGWRRSLGAPLSRPIVQMHTARRGSSPGARPLSVQATEPCAWGLCLRCARSHSALVVTSTILAAQTAVADRILPRATGDVTGRPHTWVAHVIQLAENVARECIVEASQSQCQAPAHPLQEDGVGHLRHRLSCTPHTCCSARTTGRESHQRARVTGAVEKRRHGRRFTKCNRSTKVTS